MTLDRMDAVFRSVGQNVKRDETVWTFEYLGTPVLAITAPSANRMRLVAQVIRAEEVAPEQWADMMSANFHSALDARYAMSGEWLYSIFLHPFESLSEAELRSAVSQVVTLVETFGTTYSSTGVVFGGAK